MGAIRSCRAIRAFENFWTALKKLGLQCVEAHLNKIIGEMGIFTENYLKNGNSVARAVAILIQFDLIELNL